MNIRPEAIVFINDKMVIEGIAGFPEKFELSLARCLPPIVFEKVTGTETTYVAIARQTEHASDQPSPLLPQVCLQGVWWTRQAALEADQGIASYLQEANSND